MAKMHLPAASTISLIFSVARIVSVVVVVRKVEGGVP